MRKALGVFILGWFTALPLSGCTEQTGSAEERVEPSPQSATQSARHEPAHSKLAVVKSKPRRWYSPEQVPLGQDLFAQQCAACHGEAAQGAFNWRQKQPDGKFPPPPLNGTGHAWHHPLGALHAYIKHARPDGQGNMPPFKDELTDDQIANVIAWFQSKWPDELYEQWSAIDARAKQRTR